MTAELVRRQVAVIYAAGSPASAVAAKAATTSIPIFVGPLKTRSDLVLSQPRPAGRQSDRYQFSDRSLWRSNWRFCTRWYPRRPGRCIGQPGRCSNPRPRKGTSSGCRHDGAANSDVPCQHRQGLRYRVCKFVRDRPTRSLSAPMPFHQPTCPIGPPGGAPVGRPRYMEDVNFRSRRADELRYQPRRRLASDRRVYRSHPQGHETCRPARGATEQIRTCHQPQTAEILGLAVPLSLLTTADEVIE